MKYAFVAGLLALSSVPAASREIKSARSGLWAISSTWNGGTVPGAGDTVWIANGHTVTVNEHHAVGEARSNGAIAINLNSTGALVISEGGMLEVRGDLTYTPSGDGSAAVTVQSGGIWEFDASGATAPADTHYFLGPPNGFRPLVAVGYPGSRTDQARGTSKRAIVRSNAYGGNGRIRVPVRAAYADFIRIGDAANSGFAINWVNWTGPMGFWDVQYSTFTQCGQIFGAGSFPDNIVFVHSHNVHSDSRSTDGILRLLGLGVASGDGKRIITNNVFDIHLSQTFIPGGFSFSGNYFGNAAVFVGSAAWASFIGNIVRFDDAHLRTMGVRGEMIDSYVFVDSNWGNPKPLGAHPRTVGILNGIIFGQAGSAIGPPGPTDSGELAFGANPPVPTEYQVKNSIILPNSSGHGSLEIGAWGYFPNMRAVVEHNTWFGGYSNRPQGALGNPALQLGEGINSQPHQISSFRGNILWNPQLPGRTSGFFKLADIASGYNNPNPVEDLCAPEQCDYNTGWGYTPVSAAARQYTNQGKGYASKFSSPPGGHDVDVDPMFVDYQRSLELFDSKYLGNHPDPWSTGKSYAVGALVQSSHPRVYWDLPVNYRYVNRSGCNGANPKPGIDSNWRACWEWASLAQLRDGVETGRTFDDQEIGAHGDNIITTLIKWVRAGYAPRNLLLRGAAHDGNDIGAVPVIYPSASQTTQDSGNGGQVPARSGKGIQ